MKPYSKDLRLKVLEALDRGMPRREVAQIFGISMPTIKRWLKRRRETGEVAPRPSPGPPARKGMALEEALPAQLRANPDFTLEEHQQLFEDTYGISVSTASISRAFERLGLPLKKRRSPLQSATKRSAPSGASRYGESSQSGSFS
jgi:transposase